MANIGFVVIFFVFCRLFNKTLQNRLFYRPVTFYTFLKSPIFPVTEVMKYVFTKSFQIMKSLAKRSASLFNHRFPRLKDFHKVMADIIEWFEAKKNMLLWNICEFGQALHKIISTLFLIYFPLITDFPKSFHMFGKKKKVKFSLVKTLKCREYPGDSGRRYKTPILSLKE